MRVGELLREIGVELGRLESEMAKYEAIFEENCLTESEYVTRGNKTL